VKPQLDQAVGAAAAQVEQAMAEWLQWKAKVESTLNDISHICGPLVSECDAAAVSATKAVQDLALRRLQSCDGTTLAHQLRDVSRVADFVEAGAIDLTANNSGLPDVNELPHECAHLKIDVTEFPAVAALLYANTLRGRVTVDVRTGPDRTDVPFTFTVDGVTVPTTAGGTFDTTVTTATAPLNVLLEAIATDTTLQNNNFTASEPLARPARERLQLQALGPVAIAPGGTVSLRVRVAGDGMAGASVGLTVSGAGSVSPSPVTTDGNGEATTVYTAPSNANGGGTTVTATLADGATANTTITIQAPITVNISPASATIAPGQTRQFTATVIGTTNTNVTWTETGGTINGSGLYTAGSTPGTFSVTATSVADPTKSATASVQISVAGTIILERRVSSVVAQCSAQAGSSPQVADSVDQRIRSDALATGTFSEAASAATSVAGLGAFAGNTASCTGTASQTDTLAASPTSLSVDFTGSATGNGTAAWNGVDLGSASSSGGSTFILLAFRIEGAALAYTAAGSFSSGLGGSGGSSFHGVVELYRRQPNGSTAHVVNYVRSGDHRTPTTVPGSFSTGGVLQPGRYELLVNVDCSGSAFDQTGASGKVVSCASDGTFAFLLG
jgi:hypothetical protein